MFGLIVYGSQGPYSESLVQSRGWTGDVDSFLQWLSGLSFSSAGSKEAALAEGLSSALTMIVATKNGNEAQLFGQRHCILVSSGNSFPLIRPVQLAKDQILDYDELSVADIESFLADAAAVAKSFAQSFVSLSVISPTQSQRLREIYNAGNGNNQAAECSIDNDSFLKYLILISDNFMEARSALNQGIDFGTFLVPPFQENWSDEDMWMIRDIHRKPLLVSQQGTGTGAILAAIERLMEEECDDDDGIMVFHKTVGESMISQQGAQQIKEYGRCKRVDDMMLIFQEALNQPSTGQRELLAENYFSTVPVQQKNDTEKCEDDCRSRIIQEMPSNPPMGHQEISAQNFATEPCEQQIRKERCGNDDNMIILGGIPGESTIRRQEMRQKDINAGLETLESDAVKSGHPSPQSTSLIDQKGFGGTRITIKSTGVVLSQNKSPGSLPAVRLLSNINTNEISKSIQNLSRSAPHNFKPEPPAGAPRAARKNTTGFLGSIASNSFGNSKRLRISEKVDESVSASQSLPSNTGWAFPWAQMAEEDECRLNRGLTHAFGKSSIGTLGAGNGISMTENSGEGGKGSHIVTNSFGNKTPLLQYASGALLERPPEEYVKAWEGDLTTKENGQTVFVNRLVAYRKKTAPQKLVANWPQTLRMEQLVAKSLVNNMPHGGNVEYLIFDAMHKQSKLEQLEEKRLCAYIRLPQKTLILAASVEKSRFIGMLHKGRIFLSFKAKEIQ